MQLHLFNRIHVIIAVTFIYFSVKTTQAQNISCYICSDNQPNSKCQLDPTDVDTGPIILSCDRTNCYAQWNFIEGKIAFMSRGCENKDFGNKCIRAHDGHQLACFKTCSTDLCNGAVITGDPALNFTIFDTEGRILSIPATIATTQAPLLTSTTFNIANLNTIPTSSFTTNISSPLEPINTNESTDSFFGDFVTFSDDPENLLITSTNETLPISNLTDQITDLSSEAPTTRQQKRTKAPSTTPRKKARKGGNKHHHQGLGRSNGIQTVNIVNLICVNNMLAFIFLIYLYVYL